jgi:hypothetical protein
MQAAAALFVEPPLSFHVFSLVLLGKMSTPKMPAGNANCPWCIDIHAARIGGIALFRMRSRPAEDPTPLPAGDYVWFNSVVSVRGLGSQPVNVYFSGGTITFTVNGFPQTVYAPGATMTFSPDTTQATTSFDANGMDDESPDLGPGGERLLHRGSGAGARGRLAGRGSTHVRYTRRHSAVAMGGSGLFSVWSRLQLAGRKAGRRQLRQPIPEFGPCRNTGELQTVRPWRRARRRRRLTIGLDLGDRSRSRP